MPAITTTRVCTSMSSLDHEWAIVAESVPARFINGKEFPSGWAWTPPSADVQALVIERERGAVVTVQGRNAAGRFVLYGKRRQPQAPKTTSRRAA